jgi:hypothetical protein
MGKYIQKFLGLLSFLSILSFNSGNAQTNISSNISTNTIWSKANSPYIVDGEIEINDGVNLTIEAGATIKFNGFSGLIIKGNLLAIGSSIDSIKFTSNLTSPTFGSWKYLKFISVTPKTYTLNPDSSFASGSIIKYSIIQFAGGPTNANSGALWFENFNAYISNISIRNCSNNAIWNNNAGNLLVINSEFKSNNGVGSSISVQSGKGVVSNNTFSSNNYGVSGGIALYGTTGNFTFKGNTISSNIVSDGRGGAGILLTACPSCAKSDSIKILNNLFQNNLSTATDGYTQSSNVIKIYNLANQVYINNNKFDSNTGGGRSMIFIGDSRIDYVYNNSYSVKLSNNQFISNPGKVIYLYSDGNKANDSVILTQNLFYKNDIAINNDHGFLRIDSNIFLKNGQSIISNPTSYIRNNTFNSDSIDIQYGGGVGGQIKKNLFQYPTNFSIKTSEKDWGVNYNNFYVDSTKISIYYTSTIGEANYGNNYFTAPNSSIPKIIYDYYDNVLYGKINYTPTLISQEISAPISTPLNSTKKNVDGRVVINWSSNTEADIAGYKIYYGGYTGYSYTNSIDVGNVTSTILPADVGLNEDIAVAAYDASKTGSNDQYNGNESWYSIASTIPNPPSTLLADSGPRKIKLTWVASTSSGVNNYKVYRSTDNITYSNIGSTISLNFIDSLLTPNTKYYYKLTAFDSLDLSYTNYGLESDFSNIINGTPNRIIFVDSANGNNTTGYGSITLPYKSIQFAIDKSVDTDTIQVSRGTYFENITVTSKEITIISNYVNSNLNDDIINTIIDGGGASKRKPVVSFLNCTTNNTIIKGFTITNGIIRGLSFPNNSGGGIKCTNSKPQILHCIIRNNDVDYTGGGIFSYLGSNPVIKFCKITMNNADGYGGGIFAWSGNSIELSNSEISDNTSLWGNGVSFENPNNAKITNCLFKNNYKGKGAIYAGVGGNLEIVNTTVVNNKGSGLYLYWGSNCTLKNSVFYNNESGDVSFDSQQDPSTLNISNTLIDVNKIIGTNRVLNQGIGIINGDPSFIDNTSNFKLNNYSICLGSGDNAVAPANDIEGNSRPNPNLSNVDIGAYESIYNFPSPKLNKTEPGNKKVALFWTQTLNTNIKAYKVYRSTSRIPDNSTSTLIADVTDVNILTYNDVSTDLENGTTYYYRLKAVHNDNSISGFSNELLAIPADVVIPSNFKLNNGPATTRLNWTPVGLTGAKYQLFRGTNLNSKTLLIDSLNAITYDDATLLRNTTYYYWIKTMNATGALSEFSEPIKLTPSNIWYVDSASGNNTTGIGSSILPYKRITTAVNAAITGDTILVGKGTYLDNLILTKELTIIALNTQKNTILKPLLPNSQIVNFTSGSNSSKLSGFTLTGGGNVRGSAIDCNFSSPTIERCIITNSGGEAPIRYYYSDAVINNCLIYKNVGSRVFFYDPIPVAPKVNHSTIVYNSGIGTGSSNTSVIPVFTNCIIYGNSGGTFGGNINILNSLIEGDYPGNETNINANPKFIDSSLNDYRLQDYSPAIGLGTVIPGINKDFDGNSKPLPLSSSPDAGAYENIYDHPSPYLTDSSSSTQIKISSYQFPVTGLSKIYIYKGLASNPSSKTDSIIVLNSFTDTANKIFNKYLYYRFTSIGFGFNESGYSNEIKTILFTKPSLLLPNNKSYNNDTSIKFSWTKNDNAIRYHLQYSIDSTFSSNVIQKIVNDTSITLGGFKTNSNYYWRVLATDTVHKSPWSSINKLQTFVEKPTLDSAKSIYKNIYLFWNNKDTAKTKYVKIYRDSLGLSNKLIDSIAGNQLYFKDSNNVTLNQKYYYRIRFGNYENIESDFSNILSIVPINTLPKAIKLVNKTIQNAGEFNFVKLSYSSSGSIDTDGKITSFNWYVNDSLVNKTDSVLNYFFKLGTNSIKLTVIDNDGGKDSSLSVLNISSLQKVFPAGILGGISAINPNYILTADTSFNNTTGSSVSILDRSGNTIFPIVVQSKIFTTPSISTDTSIFITNGSNLNGYSKSGVSLWPTIPLGGISYVTPTIDSNFNRIYVGVSNKNFFAYDYKTGKNIWSIICDAPINTSAVITGDRKLIFTSQAGTLYGFDISKSDIQTTPKWKMSFGDIITKSPAVDASSNIYVGTNAGRLIKFMLNSDGSVSVKWNVNIGSAIQTSPVIDADSNIYVGTEKGDFYKINRFNGSTIWSYNVGAAIYSTPNISEYGTIYVSNMNGLVTAITTDKRVLWKYQDIGPISANSLYINNMLYIASEKGSFTGIYDNPNSVNVNTSISSTGNSISSSVDNISTSKILNSSSTNISNSTNLITPRLPVWGTFQGNYRRTGSLSIICPSSLSISRVANGNLISNTPNYIQWYKDGSEILNATDSIFKPIVAGNYFIKNNQVGCNTVSSNSYYFLVTDIVNLNKDEFIKLTPNPFINFMNIDFVVKGHQRMNIEVFSASTGAKVAVRIGVTAGSRLTFNELNSGIYFVRVASTDLKVAHQFKMIKL